MGGEKRKGERGVIGDSNDNDDTESVSCIISGLGL